LSGADGCGRFADHPRTGLFEDTTAFIGLESGNIVLGAFTPVPAKHSKSSSLIDCISVGVDRMQRNFESMRKQVEAWQRSKFADVTTEVLI
jgi:hypothetical protein